MALSLRTKLDRLHHKHEQRADRYYKTARWWQQRRWEASVTDDYKRSRYCDERFDHWMNKASREVRICRDIEHQLKIIAQQEAAS